MRPSLPKGSKKLLNAWAMYDWANSVYSLTIASAIFPLFYEGLFKDGQYIDAFGFNLKNTALISFTTAAAFLLVSVISPILSGVADYVGNKKFFLKLFCYTGALACIGLHWFDLDHLYLSLLLYFLGLVGFWASLVFYNSYLPDIAFPEQQDRISAKGFSLGYIGSVLLLLFNLAMVMFPRLFGISGTEEEALDTAMRISFLTVGIWWIVFSQYTYYYLPKGVGKGHRVTKKVISHGYTELKKVWKALGDNLRLKRYLTAYFIYIMAVQTIMLIAAYFGAKEIAWESDSEKSMGLIVSILLIQLVAVAGAFFTARASARFGNVNVLIALNIIWILICMYAYTMYSPAQFYFVAFFVGLVMGGIQALSRSTYSKFLPETEDTTSYFSFYDVAEKIGIVIGMGIFALVDQVSDMRSGILFLIVLFVLGTILLFRVPRLRNHTA